MSNIPRAQLNKIPGGMPLMKQEKQIKDITKLTYLELLEIKQRELKLLSNKSHLNRLPDKGKRIQDFYEKVLTELERRSNVDEAALMFSEMNIASKGEQRLNNMEWTGGLTSAGVSDPTDDVLDSDDETQMDPLRVIAQRQMHERRVKVLAPEPQLITAEDLKEINSFSSASTDSGVSTEGAEDLANTNDAVDAEVVAMDVSEKLPSIKAKLRGFDVMSPSTRSNSMDSAPPEVDAHVRYLVDKTETHSQTQREKFKPYKTTISNVHHPDKERERKKGLHWEVTAATPPLIQNSGTQSLTLLDSIDIQSSYLAKLKELQEKQAMERMAAKEQRMQLRKIKLPDSDDLQSNTAFTAYRATANRIEGDQRYNETDEIYDPLDEELPGGAVNYSVFE